MDDALNWWLKTNTTPGNKAGYTYHRDLCLIYDKAGKLLATGANRSILAACLSAYNRHHGIKLDPRRLP